MIYMRKSLLFVILCLLLAWPVATVYAAPPPDKSTGLEQAILVKDRHADALLATPGVNGVAVGIEAGKAAIIIFTEKHGVQGLPKSVEGIPAVARESGKFVALARSSRAAAASNKTPKVAITSPVDGTQYNSGTSIFFSGQATDKEDGDLTGNLIWTSDGTQIGSGTGFYQDIEDGKHIITASVIDSGGKTGVSSVTITVGTVPPSNWWELRPVPIGVSTGHFNITAGTIGARVTDGVNVYALSNNHVYADENQASIGDNVLQPGPYDGGRNPTDSIGTLSAFSTIVFSRKANNTIDAAIALSYENLLGNSTPANGYGTPGSTTREAIVGLPVMKYGRTTGLTHGIVYAIDATINVGYDSGVARFVHQIIITPGTFSAGGDSGSLIVVDDGTDANTPVGLLFAGSSSYTIANPIDDVLTYFTITIDGQ